MSQSSGFTIDRVTLDAGAKTPVNPPLRSAWQVVIANGTAGDLQVHTTDENDLHYLVIAAGYERPFLVNRRIYSSKEPLLWIKSAGGGLVVLTWAG